MAITCHLRVESRPPLDTANILALVSGGMASDTIPERFGERLRWARERLRLTQYELSQRCKQIAPHDNGFRERDISRWETGGNLPRTWKIFVLASALEVDRDFLLDATDVQASVPAPPLLADPNTPSPSRSAARRSPARNRRRAN